MCGITGVAFSDTSRPAEPERLRAMTDVMRHRGPDGDGFHIGSGVGLGMRRLSIVDLEHGDQPIASESGAVVVVCNGEIYNAPELRAELEGRGHRFRSRSDVEVIVHLYEERGDECVHALRGMFAFALWDAPRRRLLLVRDRMGIKPLLWAERPGELLFGSEGKCILAGGHEARLDLGGLRDALELGFSSAPSSMFAGIHRLPPAHRLVWEDGRLRRVERWWSPPFPTGPDDVPRRSAGEWAEALRATLDEAVRIHLRSDVPLGTWLSPGIDSSGVTALMMKYLDGPIDAFTIGFEDARADELRTKKTLDAYPGFERLHRHVVTIRDADFTRHHEGIWFAEDPTNTALEVPRMMISELSRTKVKAVLTGEGSDEIFGGYAYYKLEHDAQRFMRLPRPVRRLLGWRRPLRQQRLLLAPREMGRERYGVLVGPEGSGALANALLSPAARAAIAELEAREGPWREPQDPRWSRHSQLQHLDFQGRLVDMVVQKLDRMSMSASLEARVPFLDHEVVELAVRIPAELIRPGGTEKWLLRQALAPVLPEEIARRKKRGLTAPAASWLRSTLPPFAEELLSPSRVASAGYFDPKAVSAAMDEHRAGIPSRAGILLIALAVQAWDDIFVRGNRPSLPPSPRWERGDAQRSGIPLPSQSAAS